MLKLDQKGFLEYGNTALFFFGVKTKKKSIIALLMNLKSKANRSKERIIL